jgi:hypothetical protein
MGGRRRRRWDMQGRQQQEMQAATTLLVRVGVESNVAGGPGNLSRRGRESKRDRRYGRDGRFGRFLAAGPGLRARFSRGEAPDRLDLGRSMYCLDRRSPKRQHRAQTVRPKRAKRAARIKDHAARLICSTSVRQWATWNWEQPGWGAWK